MTDSGAAQSRCIHDDVTVVMATQSPTSADEFDDVSCHALKDPETSNKQYTG